MPPMIDTAEAAKRLGITQARVSKLCGQRRIKGARLVGRTWMIPADFEVTPGKRGPAPRGR